MRVSSRRREQYLSARMLLGVADRGANEVSKGTVKVHKTREALNFFYFPVLSKVATEINLR